MFRAVLHVPLVDMEAFMYAKVYELVGLSY